MIQFDDYHRTIVGYHGTRLSVAIDIVNRRRRFKYSRNRDDWLGHGVYFWEYAPQQAFWWAQRRARRQKWSEPIAILASMIRLGFCFDLLDPYNVKYLKTIHQEFVETQHALQRKVPQNANRFKYLDCAVFQYAYAAVEGVSGQPVHSARAVYVPTGEDRRVWTRSWISDNAHIQVCVRNPTCILGTWLYHPLDLEQANGAKGQEDASQRVEPEDKGSREEASGDAAV
ncbi:MAG: hypothetical protein U0793_27985 [Gemmataceae bacterium]